MRNEQTEVYYPNKVTLIEFVEDLQMSLINFQRNLKKVEITDAKYVEEWYVLLGKWMEIHQPEESKED